MSEALDTNWHESQNNLLPLVGNGICLTVFGNRVRHYCRLKTADILNHQNRLAAMMNEIVFQVIAKIGWWKVDLDAYFRKQTLNKFDRRHKVTVGAH